MIEQTNLFSKDKDTTSELRLTYRQNDRIPRADHTESNGTEGDKYYSIVELIRDGRTRRVGRMFLKILNADEAYRNFFPEYGIGQYLKKYQWLKKRGFPVVPTFRVNEESEEILMTDVTQNGEKIIIDSGNTLKDTGLTIQNLEELKKQVAKLSTRAFFEGEGLFLHSDAFSILVDKEGFGELMLLDFGTNSYFLGEELKKDERALAERARCVDFVINEILSQ